MGLRSKKEMKNIFAKAGLIAAASMTLAFAGCSSNTEKEPIVGQWKLSTVEMITNGEEQKFLNPEENASFFESEGSYYEFNEDGTVIHYMENAGDVAEAKGTWKKGKEGYTYTQDNITDSLSYDADTDTLHRYYISNSTEEAFDMLDFTYIRK